MTAAGLGVSTRQPGRSPRWERLAGLLGLTGGLLLLAAFAVDIPPGLNDVRLVMFFVGAIAVGAGTYRPLAVSRRGAAAIVVASMLIANGWGLAMTIVSAVFAIPVGPGTFGVVYLWAGFAWWLADALFGFFALRLGDWARLGALALGVGSILAITGMDRLELTTRDDPTIFLPLSLTGIALNGVGWIVLGLWLMTRPRPAATSL